jgi:hypothetical protein
LTSTGPPRLVRVVTRMNIGGPARHVTILTARCGPELEGALLHDDSLPGNRLQPTRSLDRVVIGQKHGAQPQPAAPRRDPLPSTWQSGEAEL